MRLPIILAVLVALAAPLPALAGPVEDRAEFAVLATACAPAGDAKAVDKCLGNQLLNKRARLSDMLVRVSGMVGQRTTGMLAKAQREWEAYVKSTCAFHNASLGNQDLNRGRFCELRLINQRIEEIALGAEFADPVLE